MEETPPFSFCKFETYQFFDSEMKVLVSVYFLTKEPNSMEKRLLNI